MVSLPQQVLLEIEQPYANHNEGQLAFGPDTFLFDGFDWRLTYP